MTHPQDDSQEPKSTDHPMGTLIPVKSPAKSNVWWIASYAATSILGVLFICGYWTTTDSSTAGDCIGFIIVMAGICFLGYRLWQRQRWRTPTSICLMAIGVCYLLLLDGQVFTNSLVFLSCWTTSLLIRLTDPTLPMAKGLRRIWLLSMIIVHSTLIAYVILNLADSYSFQSKFNERTREISGHSTLRTARGTSPQGLRKIAQGRRASGHPLRTSASSAVHIHHIF